MARDDLDPCTFLNTEYALNILSNGFKSIVFKYLGVLVFTDTSTILYRRIHISISR